MGDCVLPFPTGRQIVTLGTFLSTLFQLLTKEDEGFNSFWPPRLGLV